MKLKQILIGYLMLSPLLVGLVGFESDLVRIDDTQYNTSPKSAVSYQVDFIKKIGSHEKTDGGFDFADCIAINSTGYIFVYDRIEYHIQVFSPAGNFVKRMEAGPDVKYLLFNASDYLYISNYTTIEIFDPNLNFYDNFQNATNPNDFTPRGLFINSTGHVYATDPDYGNNDSIHIFTQNGTFIRSIGGDGDPNINFYNPQAIVVNSSGHMFIADENTNPRGIKIINPDGTNSRNITTSIVSPDDMKLNSTGYLYVADYYMKIYTPDGQYLWNHQSPNSNGFHQFLAIDSSDNIYISDADSSYEDVKKYSPGMEFLDTIGFPYYSLPGQFNNPQDVAINGTGYYYVSDTYNHRIQIFTPGGQYLSSFGSRGSGIGQFDTPRGIDINASGHVYVADQYGDRVCVFDQNGNWVRSFGSHGALNGQFEYPYDVAINDTGHVYIADYNNERVQAFDQIGNHLYTFAVPGSFNEVNSLTINGSGHVFVVDATPSGGTWAVNIYTATGEIVRSFGQKSGNGETWFSDPEGVGLDSDGNIYVADSGNSRIKIYDTMGNLIHIFGSYGTTDGLLSRPSEIIINSTGHAHIIDSQSRLQIFKITIISGPLAPELNAINPSTSNNGVIDLTWLPSGMADNYSVYRHDRTITSANIASAMEIATEIPGTSHQDIWQVEGEWYYAVIANNESGSSTISVNQMVTVDLPAPLPPWIDAITPSTSTNGSINITWLSSGMADNYTVYRYHEEITGENIASATVVANQINTLEYTDFWPIEGDWYYTVRAENETGISEINLDVIMVTVDLSSPPAPSLNPITPSTSTTGIIDLIWSSTILADNYTIYRHPVSITDGNVADATVIASEIITLTHQDILLVEGEWWYAVMAHNETGMSLLSNSVMVSVDLPDAATPILNIITPNPSTTGSILLTWNPDPSVQNYTLLRHDFEITDSNLEDAQILARNLETNTYTDILPQEGMYWYVIIASNDTGTSPISNSESVVFSNGSTSSGEPSNLETTEPKTPAMINGYELGFFIPITMMMVVIYMKKERNGQI